MMQCEQEIAGQISPAEVFAYMERGQDVFDADAKELMGDLKATARSMADLIGRKQAAAVILGLKVEVVVSVDAGDGREEVFRTTSGPALPDGRSWMQILDGAIAAAKEE